MFIICFILSYVQNTASCFFYWWHFAPVSVFAFSCHHWISYLHAVVFSETHDVLNGEKKKRERDAVPYFLMSFSFLWHISAADAAVPFPDLWVVLLSLPWTAPPGTLGLSEVTCCSWRNQTVTLLKKPDLQKKYVWYFAFKSSFLWAIYSRKYTLQSLGVAQGIPLEWSV